MLTIFSYDFMIRAFIGGNIIATVAPIIGIFIVVKRFSLLADTLSHVSLVGVAIGLISQTHPLITSLGTSAIAALGMSYLQNTKRIFGDSILSIFLSGSLALSLVLMSITKTFNSQLFNYLFGNITTIQKDDLIIMGIFSAVVAAIILGLYKYFFLIAYDEEYAIGSGINLARWNFLLILSAALIISISLSAIGVLLIGALMVIPVLSAMQWAKNFKTTLILGIIFSVIATNLGLFASYYLDLATSGTIVLSALSIFIISVILNQSGLKKLA